MTAPTAPPRQRMAPINSGQAYQAINSLRRLCAEMATSIERLKERVDALENVINSAERGATTDDDSERTLTVDEPCNVTAAAPDPRTKKTTKSKKLKKTAKG